MSMLKQVLAFCALMLISLSVVLAEKDTWIDGITLRAAKSSYKLKIVKPGTTGSSEEEKKYRLIENSADLHQENVDLIPITIAFSENLLSSFSFGEAYINFFNKHVQNDIAPYIKKGGKQTSDGVEYWRQSSTGINYLINEFFNSDDKDFINGKDKWAMSVDAEILFFNAGYTWGIFIPLSKNYRIFKIGLGFSLDYIDLTIKLNLCEEYKVISSEETGKCMGKKEIDKAKKELFNFQQLLFFTLFEKKTKDSIWRILAATGGLSSDSPFSMDYEKHESLEHTLTSKQIEFISYTYRF